MFSEYKEKSDNNTINNDIFPLRYYSPIATRFGCIICLVPGRVDPDCGESAQTSGQPVCRSFVNLGSVSRSWSPGVGFRSNYVSCRFLVKRSYDVVDTLIISLSSVLIVRSDRLFWSCVAVVRRPYVLIHISVERSFAFGKYIVLVSFGVSVV